MASSPQPRLDPGDDPHAPQRPSVEERIQARRVVLFGVRNNYMLASYARWQLIQVRGASLFDSYAAALSVLHLLSSAVVRRLGTAGRERLKRIESLHDALRDFA